MKNKLSMIICIFTALGGHAPAQCAGQQSHVAYSDIPVALCSLLGGLYVCKKVLNYERDLEAKHIQDSFQDLSKHLRILKIRSDFEKIIGYPAAQNAQDWWMLGKIENEQERLQLRKIECDRTKQSIINLIITAAVNQNVNRLPVNMVNERSYFRSRLLTARHIVQTAIDERGYSLDQLLRERKFLTREIAATMQQGLVGGIQDLADSVFRTQSHNLYHTFVQDALPN